MTELNLRENAVSDLTPLTRLTNLIELNLHTNRVNDLRPLTDLVKIEYLTMRRNQISDISVLANLTQLRDLNLRDNQLTSIEALRNHQQLIERLNLRDNPGLTDFSPVQSYYDEIADVDFVIADTEKNFDDLTLLTGESRLRTIQNQLLNYNPLSTTQTCGKQRLDY
ncbi:internalin G [Bacillus sp. JCM 19045]|nr:internalin G [Bacillus sp. JCM 19045]